MKAPVVVYANAEPGIAIPFSGVSPQSVNLCLPINQPRSSSQLARSLDSLNQESKLGLEQRAKSICGGASPPKSASGRFETTSSQALSFVTSHRYPSTTDDSIRLRATMPMRVSLTSHKGCDARDRQCARQGRSIVGITRRAEERLIIRRNR